MIKGVNVNDRVHVNAPHAPEFTGWHYARSVTAEYVQLIGPEGEEGNVAISMLDDHLRPGDMPDLLPKWTPFHRYRLPKATESQIRDAMVSFPSMSYEQVKAEFDKLDDDAVYVNSRYQVNVRYIYPDGVQMGGEDASMAHLSIKRLDKTPVGRERYRDFMRIKDELMGTEREAVEIYPGRSRETDTANQYHLWVFPPMAVLPFGFNHGRNVTEYSGTPGSTDRHVQAPFEEHHVK